MSRLLVIGLLLISLAVGAEQTMANRNRARSTTTIASSDSRKQQLSVAQRGFKKFEFAIQADSLVRDTTVRFERR